MSKLHLKVDLAISFYNGMFIGGGKGTGFIDNFVLKDYNNKPYIPGSTIKGRIRHNYELLLNSFFKSEVDGDISQIFGEGGNNPGVLYFEDLKLQESSIENKYLYNNRVGILVSRYNKQVKDKALFQYETSGISEEQKFWGNIEGYIDDKFYKRQVVLLYTAIKMIQTLGGSQSRGLGWLGDNCTVKVFLDEKIIDENTLEKWGENIEI